MNPKNLVAIIVLFLFLMVGSLQSRPAQAVDKKPKERLAVLDLEATHGIEKSFADALSVIVRDKLHSFGEYEVMSKGDIQAVASREHLVQMGCNDGGNQCLVDFGRAIGTRFMVVGDISKLGSTYTVSLRMLDTQGTSTGVKSSVSESCKCEDDALIVTVQDVAAKLVGKPTSVAAESKRATPTAAVSAGDQGNAMQRAKNLFDIGNFSEAIRLFEIVSSDSSSSNYVEARYMMGECLFNQKEYDQAIMQYQKIISQFSGHEKAPSALLKQGMAFEKLRDNETAKVIYKKLLKKHGTSREASVANERLSIL